jgi:class 3 adenylate cyclase
LASGIVLVGHVGTEAAKNLDVLGAPMLLAGKLAELAHARRSGHLCARRTFDLTPAQMRVADAGSIDFGGTAVPLCRLEAVAGQALALADPPSAGGRGGG